MTKGVGLALVLGTGVLAPRNPWAPDRTIAVEDPRMAIPVDGLSAAVTSWADNTISLTVTNALGSLPLPYTETRKVTVRFGRLQARRYTVIVNGQTFGNVDREELEEGITIRL